MGSAGSQLAQDRSESQLGVGRSFGQEGFSLHDKWVRSKFLIVLSCQLFDIVYISSPGILWSDLLLIAKEAFSSLTS